MPKEQKAASSNETDNPPSTASRYSRTESSASSTAASTDNESAPLQKQNGASAKKLEKEIQVEEAPNWPTLLIDVENDVGKTVAERLFHWGPLLAYGIIFTVSFLGIFLIVRTFLVIF
jgi:uncharacterized Zn finger protein